jgi:hypothetical protein
MDPSLAPGPVATDRRILDHAGTEPETARSANTPYQRELERLAQARSYVEDHDPVNAAIRREPVRAMFIAAGIGFVAALLVR